jgi:hypothetical protein
MQVVLASRAYGELRVQIVESDQRGYSIGFSQLSKKINGLETHHISPKETLNKLDSHQISSEETFHPILLR